MSHVCKCHKITVKQVTEALKLLKDRRGSTTKDIYFVLDNKYGKIQRHAVQCAIKTALSKGIISVKDNRYKLQIIGKSSSGNAKVFSGKMQGKKIQTTKRVVTRKYKIVGSHLKKTLLKARVCRAAYNGKKKGLNNYIVPIRNFECRMKHWPRNRNSNYSLRSRKSYRFTEVSSSFFSSNCSTCDSASYVSSGSSTQSRKEIQLKKTVKRHYRKKYPLPKVVIKLEKQVSSGSIKHYSNLDQIKRKEVTIDVREEKAENLPIESKEANNIFEDTESSSVSPNDTNIVVNKTEAQIKPPISNTLVKAKEIANSKPVHCYPTRTQSKKQLKPTILSTNKRSILHDRTSNISETIQNDTIQANSNIKLDLKQMKTDFSKDDSRKVRFLLPSN